VEKWLGKGLWTGRKIDHVMIMMMMMMMKPDQKETLSLLFSYVHYRQDNIKSDEGSDRLYKVSIRN